MYSFRSGKDTLMIVMLKPIESPDLILLCLSINVEVLENARGREVFALFKRVVFAIFYWKG